MTDHIILEQLRRNPTEWHRRGMSAPTDIDRIVTERLGHLFAGATQTGTEPTYADFFITG